MYSFLHVAHSLERNENGNTHASLTTAAMMTTEWQGTLRGTPVPRGDSQRSLILEGQVEALLKGAWHAYVNHNKVKS